MDFENLYPIFCDCCSNLALAELDGAPLCERCLVSTVKERGNPRLLETIAPLGRRQNPIDPTFGSSFPGNEAA